jgi:hypothetical protein
VGSRPQRSALRRWRYGSHPSEIRQVGVFRSKRPRGGRLLRDWLDRLFGRARPQAVRISHIKRPPCLTATDPASGTSKPPPDIHRHRSWTPILCFATASGHTLVERSESPLIFRIMHCIVVQLLEKANSFERRGRKATGLRERSYGSRAAEGADRVHAPATPTRRAVSSLACPLRSPSKRRSLPRS